MKRYLVSAALCAALLLSAAAPASAWTMEKQDLSDIDVTFDPAVDPANHSNEPSAWAVDEVEAAIAAGLVPALTDSPRYTDAITREQFAELVVQAVYELSGGAAFDYEKTSMVHFEDYNTEAIQRAASIGVVNGTGDGNFSPKLTTNREQIASMIARAWFYLSDSTTDIAAPAPADDLSGYVDYATISDWAVDGVGTLVYNGLMRGTGDGSTLSPKDSCTVEQAILLCYRLYTTILAE